MTSTADLCVRCPGEVHLPDPGMSAAPDGQLVLDADDLEELLWSWPDWDVSRPDARESVLVPCAGPGEYEQREQAPAEQRPAQAGDEFPGWAEDVAAEGGESADGKNGRDSRAGERKGFGSGIAVLEIAGLAAGSAGQNAADRQNLTDAVANEPLNEVLGPLTANPQPPLSGPLLRQGSSGRGRHLPCGGGPGPARRPGPAPALRRRPQPSPSARAGTCPAEAAPAQPVGQGRHLPSSRLRGRPPAEPTPPRHG